MELILFILIIILPLIADIFVRVNYSINLKKGIMDLFSIGFVVCTLSGIACFWLFFKCIDWFEKI